VTQQHTEADRGSASRITPESVVSALQLGRKGQIYDLASGWWPGMPVHPIHPSFNVLAYRTPRGFQVVKDNPSLLGEANSVGYSFISELVLGTTHTGTHIDALCHVTCGNQWYGGHDVDEELGDFGALSGDAAQLPPIVARGVLLDVPKHLGVPHCEQSFRIDAEVLAATAESQGTELREGDADLVRCGQMAYWPDPVAMDVAEGSGVSLDGAEWIAERKPLVVGADNVQLECTPTGVEGNPQPCHHLLIQQLGIPILEWVNLEGLSRDSAYEFLFVCLPLSISGATGSMIRPIAIV
jgi:kynurenine formamidase